MTTERSYTRTDDAKDERKRIYLQDENMKAIEGEQMQMFTGKADEKKEKDQPMQMRYTVEVLAAGSMLYHRIDILDMSEVEFGALVSCIVEWNKSPYIGGKANIGMGRAKLTYNWHPVEGGKELFIETDSIPYLGETAEKVKARYDEYLKQYSKYLAENKESLVKMLEG